MTYWLSQPFDELLQAASPQVVDVLIVGSGYGAALAALALIEREPELSIWVFERGEEYVPGDFPRNMGDLPRHVSVATGGTRRGRADALFDFRLGPSVDHEEKLAPLFGIGALVGSGLGGTSLINANVAMRPDPRTLATWPGSGDGDWNGRLEPCFEYAETLLRVSQHPNHSRLPKYRALDGFGKAFDGGATPAPIAVSFAPGPNAQGVEQKPCIDCGNCVSGCNIGAKNSLNMNAWPRARKLGVELFTGVSVRTLARLETAGSSTSHWRVAAVATMDEQRSVEVQAATVILAAGTFGSTEILLRSRERGLGVSDQLGERLSTNGDSIAAGFGQRGRVAAIAREPSVPGKFKQASKVVGPTITGYLALAGADGTRFLVEDSAVPYSLMRFFSELVTTEGFLMRYARDELSAWHTAHPEHDPVAVSEELSDHTQVLLLMGQEERQGSIALGEDCAIPRIPRDIGYYQALHEALQKAEENHAFNGGIYLPNPAWKPLPDGASKAFAGASALGGAHLTVHPLGGCCMGAAIDCGVVDPEGRVFDPAGGVHAGLYVLDGSIVPGPLGVNPFLTIAALAYCLAQRIPLSGSKACRSETVSAPPPGRYAAVGRTAEEAFEAACNSSVAGEFNERLFLALDNARIRRQLEHVLHLPNNKLRDVRTLALDITVTIPAVYEWIAKPDQPLCANLQFKSDVAETVGLVPDAHLVPVTKAIAGTVNFGSLDRAEGAERLVRAGLAGWRYLELNAGDAPGGLGEDAEEFDDLLRFAKMHADWRYLRYRFIDYETGIEFVGEKTLAFAISQPNAWTALLQLPFSLHSIRDGRSSFQGTLNVDFIRITRGPAPLQITASPNTPETVAAMLCVGAYFARALIQTHLWSFAALPYARYRSKAEENRPRIETAHAAVTYHVGGQRYTSFNAETQASPDREARLLRYRPRHLQDPLPVLLIHGLAQGSEFFLTETIQCNLVQHLLGAGFDVWLLDYRTSANLHPTIKPTDMDEIARTDIPWAIRAVYDTVNSGRADKRGVKVVSHCIGSGCLAMAILKGHLERQGPGAPGDPTSMIDTLVTHAVTPWLFASRHNRLRANVYSLITTVAGGALAIVDPIPHGEPSLIDIVVDRLAATLPWPDTEWPLHKSADRGDGFSRGLCNRMTLFYGRDWRHRNLATYTHMALATINGPAPLKILQQFHYATLRRRLTTAEGAGVYVLEDTFEKYWTFPTLFLHGSENEVVDVESSRISAHLLAKLACLRNGECEDFGAVVDYSPFKVGLEIFHGYGHMDVMFGKFAARDVFPKISAFLSDPGQTHDAYRINESKRPRSHTYPSEYPVTGPIISRPAAGGALRVWAEADEFVTTPAIALVVEENATPLESTPRDSDGHYWLSDLRGVDQIQRTAQARLVYPPGAITVPPVPPAIKAAVISTPHASTSLALDWPRMPWFKRAYSKPDAAAELALAFATGSCLYPGTSFEQRLSDRIFAGLLAHAQGAIVSPYGLDHLLLLGDQIYADATANLFDPPNWRERYQHRYTRAFGGKGFANAQGLHAREVFAHLPTYFAIDDHEIDENWPRHPNDSTEEKARHGCGYAWRYQMHHDGRVPGAKSRFWYSFRSRGFPFFVLDTRTERDSNLPPGQLRALLCPSQWRAFTCWLAQQCHQPLLFIASGSPLGPIPRAVARFNSLAPALDTLLAYPGFLAALTAALSGFGGKIIWLAGDPHLSSVVRVTLKHGQKSATLYQICASGLCATVPFANAQPGEYDWYPSANPCKAIVASAVGGHPLTVTSEAQLLLTAAQQHFVRVDVNKGFRLVVQAYGPDGAALGPALHEHV